MNDITVVCTIWQVPFGQTVQWVKHFSSDEEALAAINEEAKKWWDAYGGDSVPLEEKEQPVHYDPEAHRNGTVADGISTPSMTFSPVIELGYDTAEWSVNGEAGVSFFLDTLTFWRLHNAHYKKYYDDKGIDRPGYLQGAYIASGIQYHPPHWDKDPK
jgi:hypothetical protein